MANTQINIVNNGTTTLKTAGKYCDRDIDVNVNVESGGSGITPTGTKEITTNGTHDVTNYANAKVNVPVGVFPSGTKEITTNGTHDVTNYASVNINVPTSSPAQPTQFTNLLTKADTIITYNTRLGITAGTTSTSNGAVMVEVTLPHFVGVSASNCDHFRFRGLNPLNGNIDTSEDGGTTWVRRYLSSPNNYQPDEHGDAVYRMTHSTISSGVDNLKVRLTLSYGGLTNTTVTSVNLTRCFMTQNEPIGNGGYVG